MSFGLVVRSFSGRISGPEMLHFCFPKTAVKSSPCLSLFSGVLFLLRRGLWRVLGHEAPLLVLESFLVGSGCAFLYGFCSRYREFFPPFLGSGVSSLFSPSLFFSSSFSSGNRPGCPFHPSLGLSAGYRTDFRYLDRRCTRSLASLSPLSARVCRRSPSLLPPSALSLSLSSSLSRMHAYQTPDCWVTFGKCSAMGIDYCNANYDFGGWIPKLHAPVMDFHNWGLQLGLLESTVGRSECPSRLPRLWISVTGVCNFVFWLSELHASVMDLDTLLSCRSLV